MAGPSLSFIVGIVGNIISILVFLSPIGTFRRVVKNKSTEDFEGLPYVSTFLSTSLWTFYGLLKPGGLLIMTVNGTGAVLQAIYVTLYLIYAPKEKRIKYLKLVGALDVGCLALVILVVLLAIHGSARITVVGILCAGLTLGMYASPLSIMRTVIKTRSVEYMPFFLSFFLFLNGGTWTFYAIVVRDLFVLVPNAIGFVLGSLQLILYFVYKSISRSKKLTVKTEEEGSAHLVKSSVEMSENEANGEKNESSLTKVESLPKTSVSKQHSFQKNLKTHSLSPYELQCSTNCAQEEEDVEAALGESNTTRQA
ncbi:hypothetical protein Syun_007943 [Stephania yunnanensis]|uniref:Bidirectional sugar transporter SWEET n=1 Tax=Stephania yunnanensis TaxID=152371 RepID=A0AAP0PYY9_9MAGN